MSATAIRYLALDARGREVRGTLPLSDLDRAAEGLRGKGLMPLELQPELVEPAPPRATLRPLRASDRIFFCRQLALFLRTGHALLPALEALVDQASHPRLAELARALSERVRAGHSLSSSLQERSELPPVVARLVGTAEETGQLDLAFSRAADHLERSAELRSQVVASLSYPFVVFLVSCAVFWFLALKVVPKLSRFLSNRGAVLPWTTETLISTSAFLQANGVSIGLGVAAFCGAILLWRRTPSGRRRSDAIALRIPLIGPILRAAALAHFARTLSLLLESGVLLLRGLSIAADASTNHALQTELRSAREAVRSGGSLAESLRDSHLGPLAARVIATGESSVALEATLQELSRFAEVDLERRLRTLSRLVEPAILVLVGGMVGFVYLAFFQAVLQLSAR